ncbi:MAG: hypothetical protein AAFY67_22985, partial [Cyanobacteria bacterium J06642_9]
SIRRPSTTTIQHDNQARQSESYSHFQHNLSSGESVIYLIRFEPLVRLHNQRVTFAFNHPNLFAYFQAPFHDSLRDRKPIGSLILHPSSLTWQNLI